MILSHLELSNFRSYESLSLDLPTGLCLIEGANAVGKSNLAEAIYYLSLARSWRTSDDRALVADQSEMAYISASVKEGELSRTIEIEISKTHKKIKVNGKIVRRLSDLSKLTNVIVFSPSDVPLFMSSPGERRNYLDVALSKHSPDYFSLISRYNRLLYERNSCLKKEQPDRRLIEVITKQMIEVAEPLLRYRSMYIASLNEVLPDLLNRLNDEPVKAKLSYRPFVKADDEFSKRAQKAYEEALESDLIHRSTSIGPHREDFSLRYNGSDIATHGSQGQNRLAVLALKLAPYFLIEEEGKKPIVVLDDALSELDQKHREKLLGLAKSMNQCFLTTTKIDDIEDASVIEVSPHKANRR